MGALGFEVMLGALTTTGSLLAFAKLQGHRSWHANDVQGPKHIQHGPVGDHCLDLRLSDLRARLSAIVLHDGWTRVHLRTLTGDADWFG